MGASGEITIYDAEAIKQAELKDLFLKIFMNVYKRTIFERKIYTVYSDDDHFDLEHWLDPSIKKMIKEKYNITSEYSYPSIFEEYLIDTWTVWT